MEMNAVATGSSSWRELPYLDLETYEPSADLLVLNLGPQHPSTHGVLRIKLYLDGEIIVKAVPYPGYLHRGVEKLCEELTYVRIPPVVDKNDYVCPLTNEQAVVLAFEKLLGIEVPRRARYLRTLLAELQRVASHLLWLGTFALDLGGALGGGSTAFLYCFRERELLLDLLEELTGSRFHYNTHSIGGNRHDIPAGWTAGLKRAMQLVAERVPDYEALTTRHPIFTQRTSGVGVLDKELALELGITGPNLRASGVDHDLRRDAPYHAYDELTIRVALETAGDSGARARVRVQELKDSLRLVSDLSEGIPEGPISSQKPTKFPNQVKIASGQTYAAVESPRGEVGVYVVAGGKNGNASPQRLKIRAPSFHALSALPYLLPGHTLSDAIVILGSLDPIMGEVDR